MLYYAEVTEQVPDRCGVQVRFMDLVEIGDSANDFVRVVQGRQSERGGASLWLPEIGELGVVGMVYGGFYIWLGSIPYQQKCQVDPAEGIAYARHQSGAVIQSRLSGDTEFLHPSGLRLTFAQAAGAMSVLEASSEPQIKGNTSPPYFEIEHPNGGLIQIDPEGNLKIQGFASVQFQEGANRFVMDALVTAYNSHTHSNGNNGSPTGAPMTTVQVNDVCSPADFQGPMGT